MVEFLRKSESRGIRIALVNSICIAKSINIFQFCMVLMSDVIEGDCPYTVHYVKLYIWNVYSQILLFQDNNLLLFYN